jgi:hypothetical protein
LIGVAAVALGSNAFAADLRIGGTHVFVPVPRILLPPPVLLPPGVAYVHSDYRDRDDRWDYRRHDYDRGRWEDRRYWHDHDRDFGREHWHR